MRSKYDLKENIGTGKFSEVYKAVHKTTGEEVAIKVIDKNKLNDKEKEMLR